MTILKYLQLPFNFDAGILRQEVKHLEDNIWLPHYQQLHYEGEWTALPLRSNDGKSDDIVISPGTHVSYRDTVFLASCPYLRKVLQSFQCPLQAVRLLKLHAGAVIKEHRDTDLCYEKGEIRLHIPAITHHDVEFYLDNEKIELKEGECWYLNVNLPHRVLNKSNTHRIHLVIDASVNDWVQQLFNQPASKKKEVEVPEYDDYTRSQIVSRLREMNTETSNRLADEMEMLTALKK